MDSETKQQDTQTTASSPTNCTCDAQSDSMMSMLEQSAVPSGICQWIKCLRGPGMALTYSMEKRHIPNMDVEKQARAQADTQNTTPSGGASSGKNGVQSSGTTSTSAVGTVKEQPGTMQCAGVCEVRYFDLAVGAMLALTVGCMLACLRGCCRCIKKKF